jgi:hypothetical protein
MSSAFYALSACRRKTRAGARFMHCGIQPAIAGEQPPIVYNIGGVHNFRHRQIILLSCVYGLLQTSMNAFLFQRPKTDEPSEGEKFYLPVLLLLAHSGEIVRWRTASVASRYTIIR